MKRLTAATALVLLLTVLGVIAPRAAWAASPDLEGWWTLANNSSVSGQLPSEAAPTPPDVPPNGLLVQGGNSATSPYAYAALVYRFPGSRISSPLTLTVASGSATTPGTTLEICPLTVDVFDPQAGGAMSDAPAYSCTVSATASPSAGGNSYKFDVSKVASDGELAIAILPALPTDRVVFDPPGADSLTISQPASEAGVDAQPAGSLGLTANPVAPSQPLAPAETAQPSLSGSHSAPVLAEPAPPTSTRSQSTRSVLSALPIVGSGSEPAADVWAVLLALASVLGAAMLWTFAGGNGPGDEASEAGTI